MAEVDADLLKRIAALVDGDQWQIADLLVERFPPEVYTEQGNHAKGSGLWEELANYEHALILNYGLDLKAATMSRYRSTSLAWPEGTRVHSAPFAVYLRLRGPNRAKVLDQYMRRNKGRPLSVRALARYKSEDAPGRPAKPWETQVRNRIESAAKAALLEGIKTDREDWWNAKGIGEARRKVVIDTLRKLASEMAS